MKKILFSSYSLDVGGIETALITLLKQINEKYEITLVLEKKEGIFLNELPKNIEVIEFQPNANKNVLIRKATNFLKQLKFKMKYKNKFDYSVSYATYSYSSSFVARNASKNPYLWVHNDYLNFYNGSLEKYKNFFKRLKVENFKKIIFVSENDKKVFINQFNKLENKTICCNNLIDYKKIINLSQEKMEDFEIKPITTFINIGRHIEAQKKLSRIIDACKMLNKEGYKFRVLFIGDGQDSNTYKEQAKNIDNIIFLGAKKNPYPYLAASDCLIMSSDYEGYPVVFLESMILNKPIITTDVSDSRQDIENKYGIISEKSTDGIYNAMKNFLDNGFKVERFDVQLYNDKILNTLDEILIGERNNV